MHDALNEPLVPVKGQPDRRRLAGLAGGLLVAGLLVTGCGGSGGGAASGPSPAVPARPDAAVVVHHSASSTVTTTTTLPACGSLRDPFDPTGAPPPAGSPAIC